MAYSLLRGPLYVGGLVSLLATSLIDRVPIAHAQSAKIERLRSVLSEIEAISTTRVRKKKWSGNETGERSVSNPKRKIVPSQYYIEMTLRVSVRVCVLANC